MEYELSWVTHEYVKSQPFVFAFFTGGGGGVVIVILGTSPRTLEVATLEVRLPEGAELLEEVLLLIIKSFYIFD